MADAVVPGVWWLHQTRGSNVYLVEAAGGQLLLVDTGFASSTPGIIEEVERVARGRAPSRILLTHAHVDHSGAAAELRARYGAEVVAGAADCSVGDGDGGTTVLVGPVGASHPLRRIVQHLVRRSRAPRVTVDVPIEGEVTVAPGVVAVPVPGHTPGSYCYVDHTHGVAFVGDLVIIHGDELTRPMKMTNADDERFLRSLREFALRTPDAGCPGHGPPLVEGFAESLRRLSELPRRGFLSPRARWERFTRLGAFSAATSRLRRPGRRKASDERHERHERDETGRD